MTTLSGTLSLTSAFSTCDWDDPISVTVATPTTNLLGEFSRYCSNKFAVLKQIQEFETRAMPGRGLFDLYSPSAVEMAQTSIKALIRPLTVTNTNSEFRTDLLPRFVSLHDFGGQDQRVVTQPGFWFNYTSAHFEGIKRDPLANRISALRSSARDEGDAFSQASLTNLNHFFSMYPRLKLPEISLDTTGELVARWVRDSKFVVMSFSDFETIDVAIGIPRRGKSRKLASMTNLEPAELLSIVRTLDLRDLLGEY